MDLCVYIYIYIYIYTHIHTHTYKYKCVNVCICDVSNNMGKPIITTNPMDTNHEKTINRVISLEVILLMKCTHYLKDVLPILT